MSLSLTPTLNVAELATDYAAKKRMQVPNILTTDSAAALHQCLASQVPWGFAYFDGTPRFYRAEEMAALSTQQRQEILNTLYSRARTGFQYAYNCYPVLNAYKEQWGQAPLLDQFLEFINSEAVLNFVRTLTGRPDIIKGDAQATRYGAGQFLKDHDDKSEEEYRVAAFVFNLTPEWHRDWGGYLQFYDEKGNIEDAFIPCYNALNIFTVPQAHSVSYIANYTPAMRYAITGWFRFK